MSEVNIDKCVVVLLIAVNCIVGSGCQIYSVVVMFSHCAVY